ncbi:hypothetical protein F183_A21610 [Bryobacterales bacterium F-183]|nr:hypothetical protein F183_A21610 [Bryobacterales bacterium F-183]
MDDSTLPLPSQPFHPPPEPVAATWGPFRLLQKVGQGGFGEVYRAFDTKLEREVALKLLLPSGLSQVAEEDALLREARAMARVRHNNVVPIYGADRYDGRVGFWSEFIKGKTLSAIITADGPLGPREAAHIGVEVCKAVSAVHAAGLLHRDIKTRNVMRESGGRILLLDFGLTHDHTETLQGGTAPCMAPELLKGAPGTVGTDLYAVGIMLFNLVTGKYPVQADTLAALIAAHESGSRLTLMDLRPDLPQSFAAVVETAIDPDPQRRFKTAGQMIAALSASTDPGSHSVASAPPVTAPMPPRSVPTAWKWAAGVATLAVLGAVVAMSPLRRFFDPAPVTSTASLNAGVAEEYQKAHDLLEHYYRPQAVSTAMAILSKIVEKEPNFAPAFADLARANALELVQQNDEKYFAPAEKAARRALQINPGLASPYVSLGILHTRARKYDLAAQELGEALRLDRFHAGAHGALADLMRHQGRDAEAEEMLQKGVKLAPDDWGILTMLGEHYMDTGKLEQALELYRRAVASAPDNPRALNNLGVASRMANRFEEAETAFRRAVELDPGAYHRYRNLGQLMMESGKYDEAQRLLERAIELRPSHYRAWGFLAEVYRLSGAPPAKAEEACRKAIAASEEQLRQRPNDHFLLADVGYYYAALGNGQKSLPLLERAALFAPNNPELLYIVALGYETLHRREDALRTLRAAVAAGLSVPLLNRVPQFTALRSDRRYRTLTESSHNK